jgi:hypothetical protein
MSPHPYLGSTGSLRSMAGVPILTLGVFRRSDTAIWRGILAGLQDFRLSTSVTIGNGCRTAFSHALKPHIPVSTALSTGDLRCPLRPRLTLAAEVELLVLIDSLVGVVTDPSLEDARSARGLPSTSPTTAISYSTLLTCLMILLLRVFGETMRLRSAASFSGKLTT